MTIEDGGSEENQIRLLSRFERLVTASSQKRGRFVDEVSTRVKGSIKYASGCTPAIRSLSDMQFCPKCSLALIPTKKEKIVVLACPKCGEETRHADPIVQKFGTAKESVVVIDREEKNLRTLPTMKVNCQKCGHGEASYWMVQTRGGDEAMTQFFRCRKCGGTWRE